MENCVAYIEYRCLTGFFNDQTMTGKVHGFFYVAERVSGDIPGLRRAMPHMKPALQIAKQQLGKLFALTFPTEENCALVEIILWHEMQFSFHLDLDGTDQPPLFITCLTFHA